MLNAAEAAKGSREPVNMRIRPFSRGTWALTLFFAGLLGWEFWAESRVKVLWLDELYTYYQVSGKSWGEFVNSLSSGANLMPPVYFGAVWLIGQIVELTPTAMRVLSLVAVIAVVPVLARALRRVASWPVIAVAIVGGLLFDRMFWAQVAEARPYAFGILLVALLAEAVVSGSESNEVSVRRWGWLVALTFLMPATHYFLGLYSAAALVAVIVGDVSARRISGRVYAAFAAGWLLFAVLCGPIFWAQLANVGQGTGWIAPSSRTDLVNYLVAVSPTLLVPLVGLGVVAVMIRLLSKAVHGVSEEVGHSKAARLSAAVLAMVWAGFPVAVLAVSVVTDRGLYVDRYFAPSVVGVVLGVAMVGQVLWRGVFGKARGEQRDQVGGGMLVSGAVVIAIAAMTGGFFLGTQTAWKPGRERLADEVHARGGLKVSADEHAYFHGLYYGRAGERYALLCESDAVRRRWTQFNEKVRTISEAGLVKMDEFVWLSPTTKKPESAFPEWAEERGYAFEVHEAPEMSGAVSTGWRTYYVFKRDTAATKRRPPNEFESPR